MPAKKELKPTPEKMFVAFGVELEFTTQFAAGIPKDPKVLLSFLEARAPEKKPEDSIPLEELAANIAEETFQGTPGEQDAITTTFKTDGDNLVYESRGVKSHIKDCAFILSQKFIDHRGLKSAVANRIQILPEKIWLYRMEDGKQVFIKEPSGNEIKPISIFTMQGPRTAVKIVDYVDPGARLAFTIKTLNDNVVTMDLLEKIFSYGGAIKGMGQDRTLGWGRYNLLQLNSVEA